MISYCFALLEPYWSPVCREQKKLTWAVVPCGMPKHPQWPIARGTFFFVAASLSSPSKQSQTTDPVLTPCPSAPIMAMVYQSTNPSAMVHEAAEIWK